MATTTGVWQEESNSGSQRTYLALGAAVGLLLVWLCHPGTIDGDSNRRAAFVLGLLILVGCAAGALAIGRQTVVVDPARRVVVSERRNRFGTKTRTLHFDDIVAVGVDTVAGHHGGTPAYHVSARLRDGSHVALFVGFFDGQFSHAAMDTRARRLETYLRH